MKRPPPGDPDHVVDPNIANDSDSDSDAYAYAFADVAMPQNVGRGRN